MSALQIEPAEGYVALEFLEDEDEATATTDSSQPMPVDNDGCYAMCVGVSKKNPPCKRGDTVIVSKYARSNGLKVSDDVVIVDSWNVKAVVKSA